MFSEIWAAIETHYDYRPTPWFLRWRYYFQYPDNIHKEPWVSRILCWLGRHEMVPEAILTDPGAMSFAEGTSVLLKCFRCGAESNTSFISKGKDSYQRRLMMVPVKPRSE